MKGLPSYPNPKLNNWHFEGDIQSPSLYYRNMQFLSWAFFNTIWKCRVFNRHFEPSTGGVVLMCNHQSFFDPIFATTGLKRPGNFMARDTLFKIPGLTQLISSLNAFPVKRRSADTGALKEAMRRLKHGRCIVTFPEGTRSKDGRLGEFLPGVSILSQRAAEWTLPAVIDGAFETWPRNSALPVMGPQIAICYGKPVHRDEAKKNTPREFGEHMRKIIIDLQTDLRKRLGKPPLKYDE